MTPGSADIVLVEDNAHDAELALYALSKGNLTAFHVEVLHDGTEALDYFFCGGRFAARRIEDYPRLVLLDLKLPKVDGIEVLRRLKGDPRVSSTPVVMFTSSREERDVMDSYRLGANGYVVKPVGFEEFARAMETIGAYWLHLNEKSRPDIPSRQGAVLT